jgi:hypothetical protein
MMGQHNSLPDDAGSTTVYTIFRMREWHSTYYLHPQIYDFN